MKSKLKTHRNCKGENYSMATKYLSNHNNSFVALGNPDKSWWEVWKPSSVSWTIYGYGGDDTIFGDNKNDYIYGGDDNDWLYGLGGDDDLYGESGNDYLLGSSGNDYLSGGSGNDDLYGGDDNDIIYGGWDHDNLYGGRGNDYLSGSAGDDWIYGGTGADTFKIGHDRGSNYDVIFDYDYDEGDKIEFIGGIGNYDHYYEDVRGSSSKMDIVFKFKGTDDIVAVLQDVDSSWYRYI